VKSLIKYLKENLLIICILIVAFFFLKKWGTGYYDYRHEIKALSDSIEQLDKEYLLTGERLKEAREASEEAEKRSALYRDSLGKTKRQLYINNIRHEKEIENLKRVPSSTLYSEYIQWIDTVSFE